MRPDRAAAQLFHQLLERYVLMRIRTQRRLRTRPSSSGKVGSPAQVARITSVFTKKPISPSSSRGCGPRCAVPTDDVALAAVAREQELQPGQQHHVRRRTFGERERVDRAAQPQRDEDGHIGAAVALRRRARPIGREVQLRRHVCQLLAPVAELTLELGAAATTCAARARSPRTAPASGGSASGAPFARAQ